MKIIPALYIQNGKVVSLYKGHDNQEKKVYSKAPHSYAKILETQGSKYLYVIDLDGDQKEKLKEIREVFHGEIWWAGKVREIKEIEDLFAMGADKIILGISAEPIYEEALNMFGAEKIMLGLKVKHQSEGPDLCEAMKKFSFKSILVKDVNAEGTLFIPTFDLYEKCVYFSGLNVYASGGVSDLRHINLLAQSGVKGVIISRAILENKINLSELNRLFPS